MKYIKCIFGLIILISITDGNSIYAQNISNDTTSSNVLKLYQLGLDELLTLKVNSATKFEEPLKDIPHSISIITKSEIETFGYRTLAEALEHVPGFYMVDDHYCYKENFGVRGFFRDEWNHNVVFLVNGVRQRNGDSFNNSLAFINVPIQSIERIEVIKGPSSVTYGTGAFMGVVNIVTISENELTEAYTSYGSQNTIHAGFNLNRKINDIGFTINSGIGKTDGIDQNYRDMGLDSSISSGNYMHEKFGYISLVAKSKFFSSSLNFDKSSNIRPVATPPFASTIYEQETNFMAIRYMLGANSKIKEWLEVNASYQFQLQQEKSTYDLFGLNNNIESQLSQVITNEFDVNLKAQYSKKVFSSLGMNLFSVNSSISQMDIPILGLSNWSYELEKPMHIIGLYYRMGWNISSKLKLKGGLRFNKTNTFTEKRKYNQGNDYIDPGHQVLDSFYVKKYQYPNYGIDILPEIALLYNVNNNHTFKLIFGTAINQPAPFNTKNASEGIKPEYIRNFEFNHIGVFSSKLRLNTSLFYNKYYDLITVEFYIQDNEIVQKSTNSGEISTIGIETEIDYQANKRLDISISGNYNHTTDLIHKEIYPAFSPKFLGVLNISYKIKQCIFALSNHYVAVTEPKYNYQPSDPTNFNSPPIGRVGSTAPAYINTGLNIRYIPDFIKGINVSLRISNLFNQKMYYPVNDYNSWATKGTLGIGRTFLISVGYKF